MLLLCSKISNRHHLLNFCVLVKTNTCIFIMYILQIDLFSFNISTLSNEKLSPGNISLLYAKWHFCFHIYFSTLRISE